MPSVGMCRRGECLFESEQVLNAVVTGERFLDRLDTGVATPIPHARQYCRIALAGKDRADDPQPGHTSNIGDDVMDLHVHFSQRLVHVLDMICPILKQTLTLTQVGTQFGDLTFGPKACTQQTEGVKPLQPLRITDVGFATGHVLGIARIDKEHRKATSVEELKDRDPIG